MNRLPANHKIHAAFLAILVALIYCLELPAPSPARCGNEIADELITLDITKMPLGEVLDEISAETGYRFQLDEGWDSFPVTASIKNEPLHKGLKRILRNLNTAVIYGADQTINIRIYGQADSSSQSAGPSMGNRSNDERAYPPDNSENFPGRSSAVRLPRRLETNQSDSQDTETDNETDVEAEETAGGAEQGAGQDGVEAEDAGDDRTQEPSEENESRSAETAEDSETAADSAPAGNE